jgi:hypothetical protein
MMRKCVRIIIALFLNIVIINCAPSKSNIVIEQNKINAKKALSVAMDCGLDNVSSVDDGKSDAYTIALGLSYKCNSEYAASVEAWAETLDNNNQKRMFKTRSYTEKERAGIYLPIVLEYRNQKK